MLQNNSGQPALGFNGAGGLWVGSSDQRERNLLSWTQVPLHRSTCAPAAPPPAMRADLHAEERGPSLRTLLFLHVGNTPPTRPSTPVCPGEEALSQGRPNLPVPRNQTGGICVFSRSHLNLLFWGGGDFSELLTGEPEPIPPLRLHHNVSPDEQDDEDVPHGEGGVPGVPGAGDQHGGVDPLRVPAAVRGQRLRDAPVPGSDAAAAAAAVRAHAAADGAAADGAAGDDPGLPAEPAGPAAPERQQPGLGAAVPAAGRSGGEQPRLAGTQHN